MLDYVDIFNTWMNVIDTPSLLAPMVAERTLCLDHVTPCC